VDAIDEGLSGVREMAAALAEFHAWRDQRVESTYEYAKRIATLDPMPSQMMDVLTAISAVERLAKAAPAIGGKVIRVPVGGAFHTPLMAPAEAELGQALMLSRFAQRHRPVVANVDAKPYVYGHVWPALALRQLTSPVRWSESVSVMAQSLGCTTLLELGPGRSLVGMARRIAPAIPAASVSHPDALADMVDR
jgi:malonyl CoA-acyl carrier protein transacylase